MAEFNFRFSTTGFRRPHETAAHRRLRRLRQQDRMMGHLLSSLCRLHKHHGSEAPRILCGLVSRHTDFSTNQFLPQEKGSLQVPLKKQIHHGPLGATPRFTDVQSVIRQASSDQKHSTLAAAQFAGCTPCASICSNYEDSSVDLSSSEAEGEEGVIDDLAFLPQNTDGPCMEQSNTDDLMQLHQFQIPVPMQAHMSPQLARCEILGQSAENLIYLRQAAAGPVTVEYLDTGSNGSPAFLLRSRSKSKLRIIATLVQDLCESLGT